MPFLKTLGGMIHYQVDGDTGPAVLMMSSIGTDLHLWDHQAAALSSSFRVVRFDWPGHGESSTLDATAEVGSLASVALAVLDAVGSAQAHLVV